MAVSRASAAGERIPRILRWGFGLLVFLALATPAWRTGIFAWWPLLRLSMLAGEPAGLGILAFLPVAVGLGWLAWRGLARPQRPWQWGRAGIALPLAGLTLLSVASLEPALTWRSLVQMVAWGLAWLVYLFALNERPGLTWPLAAAVLVQAGVAIGQFLRQADLGLRSLGELALDPRIDGISVLMADGQPWLRAYGLTGHPNVLGATLALLLLFLLLALRTRRGADRLALAVVVMVGTAGLLVSFSRTAWLGFAAGLLVLVTGAARRERRMDDPPPGPGPARPPFGWVLAAGMVVLVVAFVALFGDLALSRFVSLDTPIEATSLSDRQRDASLALDLIAQAPWRGVGAGNYLAAAQATVADARTVHNVPLLVGSELGLMGLILLVWMGVAPFLCGRGRRAAAGQPDGRARWNGLRFCLPTSSAPWLAMLVVGLFDVTLWLPTSWHAAVLFALVVASQAADKEY